MRKLKKGFTLVELLVVIAILAILATVSVVGYFSFTEKANISNDISLTTQLNTLLTSNQATEGKNKTMSEAVNDLSEEGFDLEKVSLSSSGYQLYWDETKDQVVLLDESKNVVAPENYELPSQSKLWYVVKTKDELESAIASTSANVGEEKAKLSTVKLDSSSSEANSIYLAYNSDFVDFDVTIAKTMGIDTGSNTSVVIAYNVTFTTSVIVATSGDCTLTISGDASINHYGTAKEVTVSSGSYTENGSISIGLTVSGGTVELSSTAEVKSVVISENAASTTTITASSSAKVEVLANNSSNVTASTITATTTYDSTNKTDATGAALFAGGNGSESSPYKISNEEQFLNIISGTSDNVKYYDITKDIEIKKTFTARTDYFSSLLGTVSYIDIDGKNNNISLSCQGKDRITSCFYDLANSYVKNLNIKFNNNTISSFVVWASKLAFDNVNISGDVYFKSNNMGVYVIYAYDDITIENCNCSANINSEGSYDAVFIGYAYSSLDKDSLDTTEIICKNTVFSGTMEGPLCSLLLANGYYLNSLYSDGSQFKPWSITTENLSVTGNITSYASTCTDLIAASSYVNNTNSCYYTINGKVITKDDYKTQLSIDSENIVNLATLDGFKITKNDNGDFVVSTPTDSTNITKYVMVISIYGQGNGNLLQSIEVIVDSTKVVGNYGFVNLSTVTADNSGYTLSSDKNTATKDGTTYYVYDDSTGYTITEGTKSTYVYVLAYNGSEVVGCSYGIK